MEQGLENIKATHNFLNILQALLHVPHGGVHNHVQEHLLIPKWIAEAQDDVVVVTIF